jgi:hypothetical protein
VFIEELPTALPNTSWMPAKLREVSPEVGSAATELQHANQIADVHRFAIGAVRQGFERGTPVPKAVLDKLGPAVARLDSDAKGAVG